MTTLHLGVVDVAYSSDEGAKTTGEVAEYLEKEYHIMRVFLEANEQRIGDFLAEAYRGEIDNLLMGRAPVHSVTTRLGRRVLTGQSTNGRIEERFRDFLAQREWKQASGQAVAAAEAGVSHRKKRPAAKSNKARAEFIDTGLYQASFRAWVD